MELTVQAQVQEILLKLHHIHLWYNDEEIERLFGKDDEDNNDTPSASKEPHGSNRREKIAAYLKDQQEKKMTPKLNIEKQHLSLFKEDLALKIKIMEC